MSNKLALCALLLVAFVFSVSVSVDAQKRKSRESVISEPIVEADAAEANPAASLEQCRNGATAPGVGCVDSAGGEGWVTGNAGFQNSHWAEDQFLTYRMLFSNLQIGVLQTVTIGYDILKDDVHAIDYLGTYNATETNNDPCFGVSGGCSFAPGDYSFIAVPEDNVTVTNNTNPLTNLPIDQIPGEIRMWGATINSIAYVPYAGGDERQITITFTPTVSNPVMAWGGHVAWQGDWGAGNSAGGISGSPYHMRLISLNGKGGNQDRSLSADAVVPSGVLIIKKEVQTFDGLNSSTQAFTFNASSSFTPLQFDLVDDNDGPGIDFKSSDGITLFGPNNAITVTESQVYGWQLIDLVCDEDVSSNSIIDLPNRQVHVAVDLREIVTCTFTNGQMQSTAAPATVSGRVVDSYGRGIYNARVELFNAMSGESTVAYTNSFGFYRFNEVETGEFYVLSVNHKRYRFVTGSTSFSLTEDLAVADFVASR